MRDYTWYKTAGFVKNYRKKETQRRCIAYLEQRSKHFRPVEKIDNVSDAECKAWNDYRRAYIFSAKCREKKTAENNLLKKAYTKHAYYIKNGFSDREVHSDPVPKVYGCYHRKRNEV